MAKNIQMNVLGSDGQYEDIYPQTTVENIVDIQDNYYTKNEILTNATAALFGLGTDAVPDDVLSILSKVAQYSWLRRINRDVFAEVKTNYTVSTETGYPYSFNQMCVTYQYSTAANILVDVQYSDTVSFNSNGTPYLENPQTVQVSYNNYTNANILSGKYYYKTQNGTIITDKVYYAYPNQVATRHYTSSERCVYFSSVAVISSTLMTEIGTWERLFSTDENAYPTGIVNGYEYIFMNTILNNTDYPVKIANGSYKGTGTYGKNNPNTLTFGFEPAIVFIVGYSSMDTPYWPILGYSSVPGIGSVMYMDVLSDTSYISMNNFYIKKSSDSKTVIWYSNNAGTQYNDSGSVFYYLAIG